MTFQGPKKYWWSGPTPTNGPYNGCSHQVVERYEVHFLCTAHPPPPSQHYKVKSTAIYKVHKICLWVHKINFISLSHLPLSNFYLLPPPPPFNTSVGGDCCWHAKTLPIMQFAFPEIGAGGFRISSLINILLCKILFQQKFSFEISSFAMFWSYPRLLSLVCKITTYIVFLLIFVLFSSLLELSTTIPRITRKNIVWNYFSSTMHFCDQPNNALNIYLKIK